jgi:uroporphyrinogen-III synthase
VVNIGDSPLTGKIVIVTRAEAQSGEICEALKARGATARLLPLISFAPPENCAEMDAALKSIASFDWVVFTSVNAVQALERRGELLGIRFDSGVTAPHAAAVGPATSDAAEGAGFAVEYVAAEHSGAGLARELGAELRGKKVLLPRSDRASPDLPAALRKSGAVVTEVVAYRNLPPNTTDRGKVQDSVTGAVDAILFYSPSAVQNFMELAGREKLASLQGRAVMVAIGHATSAALHGAGIQRIARAADTTTKAVIEALEGHLARTKKRSAVGANEE